MSHNHPHPPGVPSVSLPPPPEEDLNDTWTYLTSFTSSAAQSPTLEYPQQPDWSHAQVGYGYTQYAPPSQPHVQMQMTVAPSQLTAEASPITSSPYAHSPSSATSHPHPIPFPTRASPSSPAPSRRGDSLSYSPHLQAHPYAAYAEQGQGQQQSAFESTVFLRQTLPSGRQRIEQACEKCRERKAKCNGSRPTCQRCLTRGLTCVYAHERRMRGPNKTGGSSFGGSVGGSGSQHRKASSSSTTSSARMRERERSSLSSSPTDSTASGMGMGMAGGGGGAGLARKFASTPQLRPTPSAPQQPSPLAPRPVLGRVASYSLHPPSTASSTSSSRRSLAPPPHAAEERIQYSVERPMEPEDHPVQVQPRYVAVGRPELGLAIPVLPQGIALRTTTMGVPALPPPPTQFHPHQHQPQQYELQYPDPNTLNPRLLVVPVPHPHAHAHAQSAYPTASAAAAYFAMQAEEARRQQQLQLQQAQAGGTYPRQHQLRIPTPSDHPSSAVSLTLDSPTSSSPSASGGSGSARTANSRISPLTDLHVVGGEDGYGFAGGAGELGGGYGGAVGGGVGGDWEVGKPPALSPEGLREWEGMREYGF